MCTASRPPCAECTLLLAGAHPPDLVIFLGLAVYAVAGCKAQDLRVESSNQVGHGHSSGPASRDGSPPRGCFRDCPPPPLCVSIESAALCIIRWARSSRTVASLTSTARRASSPSAPSPMGGSASTTWLERSRFPRWLPGSWWEAPSSVRRWRGGSACRCHPHNETHLFPYRIEAGRREQGGRDRPPLFFALHSMVKKEPYIHGVVNLTLTVSGK